MTEQFFELLRGGLWSYYTPKSVIFDKNIDWKALFELSKTQTVIGIVWDGVTKLPLELQPPRTISLKWYAYVVKIEQSNKLINSRIKEINSLYQSHSLTPVLMKGASIAALYPNPLRRGCGDIDLYFGKENIDKANQIIIKHYNISKSEIIKDSTQTNFKINNVEIENHRKLSFFSSFRLKNRFNKELSMWFPCDIPHREIEEGIDIAVIPNNFNTQFLYIHTMRHFIFGGVGLRQLCDLAITIRESSITKDDIIVSKRDWKIIERLLVKHLGLDAEFAIYNDKKRDKTAGKVLNYVIQEGNFGVKLGVLQNRPKGFFSGKLYDVGHRFSRWARIISLFPREVLTSLFISTPIYFGLSIIDYFKGTPKNYFRETTKSE